MRRFLVLGGFVALGLALVVLSFIARRPRQETMVWTRGQTPTESPQQTLDRGRIGSEAPMPQGLETWSGRLVDAGCVSRSMAAWGGGCAITANTRSFAVYLSKGELKNFDEGGNTKVLEALQGTSEGQAVLNGKVAGASPEVRVTGKMWGDKILVDSVKVIRSDTRRG